MNERCKNLKGVAWSDAEIEKLGALVNRGLKPAEVSRQIGRSISACKSQTNRQGLRWKHTGGEIEERMPKVVARPVIERTVQIGRLTVSAVADDPADAERFLALLAECCGLAANRARFERVRRNWQRMMGAANEAT